MWAGKGRPAGGAGWPSESRQETQVLFPGTHSVRVEPGAARRLLRRRTFYPSGGCAGTESWKRPFPGSGRQGENFKGMLSWPGVRPQFHKLGTALENLM